MIRKAWGIGFFLLLALTATSISARPKAEIPDFLDYRKGGVEKMHIVNPDAVLQAEAAIGPEQFNPDYDRPEFRRDPLGALITVGYTWYDYQHNGTIGKMIAKDSEGGVHFVWMKGYDSQQTTRHVVYNYLDENGNLYYQPDEDDMVDNGDRSGYTCLALLPADQRAIIYYHVLHPPNHAADYLGTALGVDFDRGFGAFVSYYPNPWANVQLIWPHGAMSRNNIAHILSTESPPTGSGQDWQRIGYWRGTPDQTFEHWDFNDPPINVDTAGTISANVCASRTSNKVAMVWFHNRIGADQGPWADVGGYWQRNNDIRYIISDDGRNFDFQRNIRSMTKIIPPNPALAEFDLQEAYGDTFRPYCDVDMQFDPWGSDHLYATFATCGFWEEPYEDPNADGDPEPCDGATGEHDILWFWNSQQDTITMVYYAWYFNRSNATGSWRGRPGAWRMNADRGSIAFNPDDPGTIYLVWVNYSKIQELNPDYNADPQNEEPFFYDWPAQDTSAMGYRAADVMVSISTDYGITWREPINVTETIWEGEQAPRPGEMESEAWTSVAYVADDTLHIFYVDDLDAGGVIQTPAEGQPTYSPVKYQRIPINMLELNDPVELPIEGFMFHNYTEFRPQITQTLRNPVVPMPANQVQISSTVVGAGGHDIQRVQLAYRVNNGDEHIVNMELIAGDNYGASIPAQDDGYEVWYQIRATNDVGLVATAPSDHAWFGYFVRANGVLTIHDLQYRPDEFEDGVPWDNDYSFYKGYEITVSGTVTTPASFHNAYDGFAIQDAAERWSGIIVRSDAQVAQGDRVTVTGTVFEKDVNEPTKWQFQTYIEATNVQVIGQEALPEPIRVSVEELTFGGGVEGLEGVLVEARNVFVNSLTGESPDTRTYWPITDGDFNGWFSIIGLSAADVVNMGIQQFVYGTELTRISGVITENFGHYAILMRGPSDLGPTKAGEPDAPNPMVFRLSPAFPNPFNAVTTINFSLPRSGVAEVGLFDLQGRLVANILANEFSAGEHSFSFDAGELPTGVYVVRLDAMGLSASRKVVLMK